MKELEAEAKELLAEITPHLNEDMVDTEIKGARGVFTIRLLPRYEYPADIISAREALKELEATARAEGDAELVENKISLVYTRAK